MEFEFTTDPARRSFVDYGPDCHFPIQNLPFGIFSTETLTPRCCIAIGDFVLDLAAMENCGLLPRISQKNVFEQPSLNAFAGMGKAARLQIRRSVSELLDAENAKIRDDSALCEKVLIPQDAVTMHLPMQIGDYTDFYSSKEHATNVGIMFRGKDNALQPNWLHLPVAYHGRASSIVVSGTSVKRPSGQKMPPDADIPVFGTSAAMDFELEMGFYVGSQTAISESVPVDTALDHVFGLSLVNDWSARDIQRWEYVPLGPFLGKNFATTVSPWIVTLEALTPFACQIPEQVPHPLEYLSGNGKPESQAKTSFDIALEVSLATAQSPDFSVICKSNFRHLYWSMSQQLAHHTVNGCNVRSGDLLASGTISGSTPDSFGSMLELAWKGEKPLTLPNGEVRKMLQDGDTVKMTGWAQGEGYRIGFGEVTGELYS
ncbi:MAG: fumarylacetoacetase [Planctomycetota bacterium]